MNNTDEFLIKEYESAQRLTYHVDDLRSKLTQFFIALSGVALAAISTIATKDIEPILLGMPWRVAASIAVIGCASLGVLFVLIVARLRRTQIEHFHITNSIRQYFLEQHDEPEKLWKVVGLSASTIPSLTRCSGSYYWILLIIILTSFLFSLGVFLLTANLVAVELCGYLFTATIFIMSIFALDKIYMKAAKFEPKVQQTNQE
ncbi:hypothetical protein [Vibrio parahaemolyticus]|uniref:hypothetical protein n=1 Tax=Vibrio parahaemolyticus TaxID=670 RepID=UPI0005F0EC0F|nr:hypothetical protein [Vibrio parahaemolyticus]